MNKIKYLVFSFIIASFMPVVAMQLQQKLDPTSVEFTKSVNLIRDVLVGSHVRAKAMQQLELARTTKAFESFEETWSSVRCEYYLHDDKETLKKHGYMQYHVPYEGANLRLGLLEAYKRRSGVGTFLFNALIENAYEINKKKIELQQKPFTKITWTASPIDGIYSTKALDNLIKFYESLGAKISERQTYTAEMYFDLSPLL